MMNDKAKEKLINAISVNSVDQSEKLKLVKY